MTSLTLSDYLTKHNAGSLGKPQRDLLTKKYKQLSAMASEFTLLHEIDDSDLADHIQEYAGWLTRPVIRHWTWAWTLRKKTLRVVEATVPGHSRVFLFDPYPNEFSGALFDLYVDGEFQSNQLAREYGPVTLTLMTMLQQRAIGFATAPESVR